MLRPPPSPGDPPVVRHRHSRLAAALALSVVVAPLLHAPSARAEELTVTVLHTTDMHGALAAWDDWNDREAGKGLEKLATMIGAARAEGHPTLLVDAGDALYGIAFDQLTTVTSSPSRTTRATPSGTRIPGSTSPSCPHSSLCSR